MNTQYSACIEACLRCATACNHCASSCIREQDIQMMAKCIQLDMECAAFCYASAQVMSLQGEKSKTLCLICAEICETCAAECSRHPHDHCQTCAQACLKCVEECRKMAA